MVKPLKKVFLPSGLIASLYNVYGGSGKTGEVLTTHDIHLLCSYLEFYFNYTDVDKKKYVYCFYTIPQFYSARLNDELDKKTLRENASLQGKYITKVSDEIDSPFGELYRAMLALKDQKSAKIGQFAKGMPSEVDEQALQKDPTIDYENLAKNPYAYGNFLQTQGFRTKELYDRVRTNKNNPSEKFSLFVEEPCRDASSFYLLHSKKAFNNMTKEEFQKTDYEMRRHLANFFSSDSYKVFAITKSEQYAPTVDMFLSCFKNAVQAYNKMNVIGYNQKYSNAVNRAKDNMIDLEVISE